MTANILIVDDQPHVRQFLSEELIYEGYRVATAGDAESAKGYLRSSRPDLLVLDLYLDGLEGFEVLDEIRRQGRRLPVIVFTAYDSYRDDPRLSWVDGYVMKSFEPGELKQNIARVLGRKSATPSSQGGSRTRCQASMAK
jgi:DNA-binding response OmpR family regulator